MLTQQSKKLLRLLHIVSYPSHRPRPCASIYCLVSPLSLLAGRKGGRELMTHGICLMMANRGYLSPPNHYPDLAADRLGLLGFHIFLHLQRIIPKVH